MTYHCHNLYVSSCFCCFAFFPLLLTRGKSSKIKFISGLSETLSIRGFCTRSGVRNSDKRFHCRHPKSSLCSRVIVIPCILARDDGIAIRMRRFGGGLLSNYLPFGPVTASFCLHFSLCRFQIELSDTIRGLRRVSHSF